MKVSCYSVCHSWYDNEEQVPLLLHCGHGFYKACLSHMFAASTDASLSCPRHHHPPIIGNSIHALRKNFLLLSLLIASPSFDYNFIDVAALHYLSPPSLSTSLSPFSPLQLLSRFSLSLYLAPPSLLRRRPAGSTEGVAGAEEGEDLGSKEGRVSSVLPDGSGDVEANGGEEGHGDGDHVQELNHCQIHNKRRWRQKGRRGRRKGGRRGGGGRLGR